MPSKKKNATKKTATTAAPKPTATPKPAAASKPDKPESAGRALWICEDCAHEVIAAERPSLSWNDGHVCRFKEESPAAAGQDNPKPGAQDAAEPAADAAVTEAPALPPGAAAVAPEVPPTIATEPAAAKAAATITAEEAMQLIGRFAEHSGAQWRPALRALWGGEDDGSPLWAAQAAVPPAILDNLTFKVLAPELEAARRLRAVGTAMNKQAKALRARAKELHGLARQLRQKGEDAGKTGILRTMLDGGRLEELEAEVAK